MLVASDGVNGIGNFQWEKAGDAGAIEVPDFIAFDLINRNDGHYWSTDGTKPAPKPEVEVEPEVPLQEDETVGNDINDAISAANVGPTKAARARKTTKKE